VNIFILLDLRRYYVELTSTSVMPFCFPVLF